MICITVVFSSETWAISEDSRMELENSQTRIVYPAKISFRNESEIEIFFNSKNLFQQNFAPKKKNNNAGRSFLAWSEMILNGSLDL